MTNAAPNLLAENAGISLPDGMLVNVAAVGEQEVAVGEALGGPAS